MARQDYVFTSESVSEGHPDKLCDQISDAVLDALLAEDPAARVACETFATTGTVVYAGYNGGYGNYIKIDHGGGIGTGYAHIRPGGFYVGYGQRVNAGDLIGSQRFRERDVIDAAAATAAFDRRRSGITTHTTTTSRADCQPFANSATTAGGMRPITNPMFGM